MHTTHLPRITLPRILPDAHKYTRGSLLVLAGSRRFSGAGVLASLASEKGGAGYTTLATPKSTAQVARTHLVTVPVIEADEDESQSCFGAEALWEIVDSLQHVDAVCCGPGMTSTPDTKGFLNTVLQHTEQALIPLLLDADALNILAQNPELLAKRKEQVLNNDISGSAPSAYAKDTHGRATSAPDVSTSVSDISTGVQDISTDAPDVNTGTLATSMTIIEDVLHPLVLTPHAGELARLFKGFAIAPCAPGKETDRIAALSQELSATIVAKGPTTIVVSEGSVFELKEATPALAKAGTGDVLAGLIGSLLAQGMTARDAALAGVVIHSRAGILAESKQGTRSVTATDVIEALPQAVQEFEKTQAY